MRKAINSVGTGLLEPCVAQNVAEEGSFERVA